MSDENRPNMSSRMIASVLIEFDTGSEYGGKWTFQDAYDDAMRAVNNTLSRLAKSSEDRIRIVKIESIRSHVTERKT